MNNKGEIAEDFANSWLQSMKFKILSRNFHSRWGEIDFIGIEDSSICFLEVRYRKSSHYGTPAETVTFSKQQRIIKTAQAYLNKNQKYVNIPARFDVLGLSGDLNKPEIDWRKNAFMMST